MLKKMNSNVPAAYLILFDKNKILLLKRYNTGYEDGNYSFIAGHVEPGETFTQCIIREAEEEAGIKILAENIEVVHIMHRRAEPYEFNKLNERVDVFFRTKKWEGEIINKEPTKCDELTWVELGNMPDNIITYIKQAIENIGNNIFYSEHGW